MKAPLRGRGRGGGEGRGRGRGAKKEDVAEPTVEEKEEEEYEADNEPDDSLKEKLGAVEVPPAKPAKAKTSKEPAEPSAKRKRGKQPESPKAKAEATSRGSKRKRKAANPAAPIYEANEKKIKTMTNFCGKFDLDLELDDLRSLIKCEFPDQWEFAKLTPYWTRAQCTVRKWEKGWHDCAFFSFESQEEGPHNLKLILVVAAGMRLVPRLNLLAASSLRMASTALFLSFLSF